MKKILQSTLLLSLTLILIISSVSNSYSAEPNVADTSRKEIFFLEVPSLPTKAERELYEEQALYTMKLMEYYSVASGLETVVKLSGAKPVEKVPIPTAEVLTEPDFKILNTYHKICMNLKNQVETDNILFKDKKLQEFYRNIEKLKKDNFNLSYDNKMLKMDNELYKSKFNNLIDKLQETNKKIDSLEIKYINEIVGGKLNSLGETVNLNLHYYPVLHIKAGLAQSFLFNNTLNEKSGFYGQMNFVPGPLWGIGEYFDIFGGVHSYNIYVNGNKFNTNVYNYGLDLIVPFSKFIKMEKFNLDLKLGFGFFKSRSVAPNTELNNSNWSGQLMRFELNAYNTGNNFPVGIFTYYTFYYNNNDITFPLGGGIDYSLKTNWSGAFGAGITLPLWNVLVK